jgi:hypothetical protein
MVRPPVTVASLSALSAAVRYSSSVFVRIRRLVESGGGRVVVVVVVVIVVASLPLAADA